MSVMLTSGLFSRNGEQFCQYFFFYRRQSSTINNSAVIKQFLGQWAYGSNFSLNTSQSHECLISSHIFNFIHYFTQMTNKISEWFLVRQFGLGCCGFLHCCSKYNTYIITNFTSAHITIYYTSCISGTRDSVWRANCSCSAVQTGMASLNI